MRSLRATPCRVKSLTRSQGPNNETSESTGIITDILTEPGRQANVSVTATAAQPRYEVSRFGHTPIYHQLTHTKIQNYNTGKTTSVFEENIIGWA